MYLNLLIKTIIFGFLCFENINKKHILFVSLSYELLQCLLKRNIDTNALFLSLDYMASVVIFISL